MEKNEDQIMRLVTAGVRPPRLDSPRMEEGTWDFICNCWKAKPSERPSMEQIHPSMEQIHLLRGRVAERMAPRAKFRSLITDLNYNKVYCVALSKHCTSTDNSLVDDPRRFRG